MPGSSKQAIYNFILGDIIGFGNGKMECNNGLQFIEDNYKDFVNVGSEYANELTFDFIFQGGFSKYPLPKHRPSYHTLLMLATCRALINGTEYKDEYLTLVNEPKKMTDFSTKHGATKTTIKSLKRLLKGDEVNVLPESDDDESSPVIRSVIIGRKFYLHDQYTDLVRECIKCVIITHPNNMCILSSVMGASFCAFAKRGIEPHLWLKGFYLLLDENDIVKRELGNVREDLLANYDSEKRKFIEIISKYYEDRFDDKGKFRDNDLMKYPSERMLFYSHYENMATEFYPGKTSIVCLLMAYDCLLMSNGSFDKVVLYSMVHSGNSSGTGALCAFYHGLVWGQDDISRAMVLRIDENVINESTELINQIKI